MQHSCLFSKDSLQARLEQMERENPSSEETRNKKSGFLRKIKEKVHFGLRKVKQVEYNPEKYVQPISPESMSYEQRMLMHEESRKKALLEQDSQEYANTRRAINQILSMSKKVPSDEKEIRDIYGKNVVASRSQLGYELDKMKKYELATEGDSKRAERYGNFAEKRLNAFYAPIQEKADRELDEIISGRKGRITIPAIEGGIHRKLTFSERENPANWKVEEEGKKYAEQNLGKIPFVPLKELEEQGITLVHGFSGYPGRGRLEHQDKQRLAINNPDGYTNLYRGDISPEELASKVITEKPPLSASSVTDVTSDNKFFSAWGIILGGEGRVYDAEERDISTMPYGNTRIRFAKSGSDNPYPLHERVEDAVRHSKFSSSSTNTRSNMPQDEFSVGGDYAIKGIYFVPSRLPSAALEHILGFAKEKGLKVYEFKGHEFREGNFTEGEFVEYKKPKLNSRRKIKK